MATLLALTLGVFAVVATIPTLTLILSFAAVLRKTILLIMIPAIVASLFGIICLTSMIWLLCQHIRQSSGQDGQTGTGRRRRELLTLVTGLFCFLFAAFSLATLVWMQIRSADLPRTMLGTASHNLLKATFVVWTLSSLAKCSFLTVLLLPGRNVGLQIQPPRTEDEPHHPREMLQTSRPQTAPPLSRGREYSDAQLFSSVSRKRSGSDTMNSIRSSITHVVRPISSKTRLVSQTKPYRPTSLDSGTGERELVEDGFDSWDLSAVEPHSRHFVMSAANSIKTSSPNNGRFLETIPASPTGSRSPSPGFPLDLEPPPRRRRSRSHSPATTIRPKHSRDSTSSAAGSEAHIHPLFRTDSPTPPPSATPGTVVTAAPGAGQAIINRQSVRRMRSGSLPNSSSPLGHSRSFDDVTSTIKDDDESSRPPSPPEREMTPPIPDWILGAGPRNSLTGYSRRKGLASLGPLGEGKES